MKEENDKILIRKFEFFIGDILELFQQNTKRIEDISIFIQMLAFNSHMK